MLCVVRSQWEITISSDSNEAAYSIPVTPKLWTLFSRHEIASRTETLQNCSRHSRRPKSTSTTEVIVLQILAITLLHRPTTSHYIQAFWQQASWRTVGSVGQTAMNLLTELLVAHLAALLCKQVFSRRDLRDVIRWTAVRTIETVLREKLTTQRIAWWCEWIREHSSRIGIALT